jgi:Protein of unknown function (DUF3768)
LALPPRKGGLSAATAVAFISPSQTQLHHAEPVGLACGIDCACDSQPSFWRIRHGRPQSAVHPHARDHLRKHPTTDLAIITPSIAALGREAFDRIMESIMVLADICHEYEPDEEQHTGTFPSEGRLISFKIDHYKRPSKWPRSARTGQTDRVRIITVMLAEEN